jgi:hypothetical protein
MRQRLSNLDRRYRVLSETSGSPSTAATGLERQRTPPMPAVARGQHEMLSQHLDSTSLLPKIYKTKNQI